MDYQTAKNQGQSRVPLWLRVFLHGLFHPPSMDSLVQPENSLPYLPSKSQTPPASERHYNTGMPENHQTRKTIPMTARESGYRGRK